VVNNNAAVMIERRDNGVALVLLNRPSIRNAMTEELTAAWVDAVLSLQNDRAIRAVVVTGVGNTFCAGADLSWLDQAAEDDVTPDRLRDKMMPLYRAWLSIRELPVPVIAAVNGPAVGAGLCLALACDLRYAANDARFSASFIYVGTHGGMGVTSLLPDAVGSSRAREMLFTGRWVDAPEALDWGLVSGRSDDVVELALENAARVAQAAPIAARLTKRGLNRSDHLTRALEWESLAQPITLATGDIHEGVRARREHRSARFEGR
jgi:enoyl-CoA hydratase/carnithine racemase